MSMRVSRVCGALGAVVLSVALVSTTIAHHANSAYDRERTIDVTGVVTGWQFFNPHVGIFLDVTDEQGSVIQWAGEFTSIQDLYRNFGWNKNTFQPGDRVTIQGNPDRREGHNAMWVSLVVMPDGTEVDVRNIP